MVVCFHNFELGNLHIQIHTLFDARITGTQRLDFRKGQRRGIYILTGAHRGFRGHNLRDKPLLVLHGLPEVGIKGSFGDIAAHMDFFVLVALAFNTAFSLGKVTGSPRAIQIVQGN